MVLLQKQLRLWMSEVIKLSEATQNLPKLENEIRKGGVIVIPIEGSYVYLAEIFIENGTSFGGKHLLSLQTI